MGESWQLTILECSCFDVPVPSVAQTRLCAFLKYFRRAADSARALSPYTDPFSLLFPPLFPPLENFTLSPSLGRNDRDQKE